MSTIKIVKAKLNPTKKGTGLIISSEELDDAGEKITSPAQTYSAVVQKEITDGFSRLNLHLAIMAGYVKAGDVEDIAMPDPKLSEGFHVKGFSIGGDEGEGTDGVILSGSKILAGGKSHNFNTPFYRFNEGEASRYAFMDDVVACLTGLEGEIIAYKKGEKRGTPAQSEMDFKAGEKVTEEGNAVADKDKHKYADKDAMQRVAEMDGDGKGKKKAGGKKKADEEVAADAK